MLLNDPHFMSTSLSDSNGIRTHNHLVCKQTLNHLAKLASLAKWLSIRLRTKWLWVRIPLLSLKLQIWRLLQAGSSLTFRQNIECGFTLKLVRNMIVTYSQHQSYFEKRNRVNIWRLDSAFPWLFNLILNVYQAYYSKSNKINLCRR